jgi:hypothetical protein
MHANTPISRHSYLNDKHFTQSKKYVKFFCFLFALFIRQSATQKETEQGKSHPHDSEVCGQKST